MQNKLRLSEQVYAFLLNLYPKPFRATYGRQMRLTFRDACRGAYRRNGVGGLMALWVPTLLDLFKSLLEAWTRQGEISMVKARLVAWSGPLTVLLGLLWAVAAMGEFVLLMEWGSSDTFWDVFWLLFVALSFIPMPFALIGTLLRFQNSVDALGKWGLRLSVAGAVGMVVLVLTLSFFSGIAPDVEQGPWSDYGVALCSLSIFIGYMVFGVSTLRYRLLPRWNLFPLLIGIPILIRGMPDAYGVPNYHPIEFAVSFIQLATTGVCWILIGVAMMEPRQDSHPIAVI